MAHNLMIKVDVLGGTSIDEAVIEAKALSQKLDVGIEFNFNGVHMSIFPHRNVVESIEQYHKELYSQC